MPTITIREQPSQEQQTQANGFRATLSFEDEGEYEIQVCDPLSPQDHELLAWYFEQWLYQPHLEDVIAQRAMTRIHEYGHQLFEQVFGNRDAYSLFQNWRTKGLHTIEFEILSRTPEFQALHWESLWPKDRDQPLGVDCVFLRRVTRGTSPAVQREASPLLNLLVVTARPKEESDVGYRTISRPLFESLGQSKIPVNIELLRPGTYKSLIDHLQKHPNFYHIIHFDLHGALLTYEQFTDISEGKRANPEKEAITFKARIGRKPIKAYEGMKAFLAFEGEFKGETDLAEASEIAALLRDRGVQVCILNACQSSKQIWPEGTDNRETSLTSYLMDAGIQLALGMSYSVTVSAAERLIPEMYKQIFANKSIPEAIRLGRLELFNNKERRVSFGKNIPLEDWLLPVVYAKGKVNLNLRSFQPEEEEKWLEERSQSFPFTEPTYGFIGRDLDILKIEKSLLRHNLLLVKGMGGTGKTTLLNYLGMWWQQTRFVEEVFYFGYDEQAFTLESILAIIAKSLLKGFAHSNWQAMNPAARQQKIIDLLNSHPHCLFLDNLESISGRELAIAHTLPVAEREKLKKFLAALSGGMTKVVLGSRSQEEWLQPGTFRDNIHEMRGLDPEARTQLAEKILLSVVTPKRAEKTLKEPAFERLMKLLAGYPLAMEVVLRNLKNQTPEEVLTSLQVADVNLDTGGEGKTESILKCVEYSHSNIAPELQEVLLCLAPFTSFIGRDFLPVYITELQKQEALQSFDLAKLDAALQEAIQWGLLSQMYAETPNLLTIQPVFPYFLKTKLEAVDSPIQSAIERAFREYYRSLAGVYGKWMESKEAEQRQDGITYCRLEYENLYRALELYVAGKEEVSIFFCLSKYLELIQDKSANLKLTQQIWDALTKYPDAAKKNFETQILSVAGTLATRLLEIHSYLEARQQYELTKQLIHSATLLDEKEKQTYLASVYHNLGRVAEESREWEQAKHSYQQALDIKIQLNDVYSQASTYYHLGIITEELKEFEQAKQYCQQALDIYVQFNALYEQAMSYYQIGIIAYKLREFEQAKQYCQQVLDILIQFNDVYSQARPCNQLGNVAMKLQEYEQAKQYYQQALNIYIQFNALYEQASTFHNLGSVSLALREYEQAWQYYQQSLNIFTQQNDVYYQAITLAHMGSIARVQEQFEEATNRFLAGLKIFTEYKDEHFIQVTISNLIRIYQQHPDEQILVQTAQILGVEVEQIRSLFEQGGEASD
jgi:tetratricopeptide (TPR) repeat protein